MIAWYRGSRNDWTQRRVCGIRKTTLIFQNLNTITFLFFMSYGVSVNFCNYATKFTV